MIGTTAARTINRVLFGGTLVVLVMAPLLYGSNRAMYWAFTEVAIFVLFAVRIMLVPQLDWSALFRHPARNFVILLCLVAAWLGLQANGIGGIRSFDYHATLVQMLKTISFVCLAVLLLSLIDSRDRLRFVAWTLVASGTFQAVYGTLVALGANSVASGTFVNRNHLAGYLEMTLSVGLGLLMADLSRGNPSNWRESLRRWISALLGAKARTRICLALMVIGLIVTRSRMGNTAFFSAMLVAAVIGLVIFRRSTRSVILLFASLIVIDTLLMGTFFGIDKLQQRVEQTNLATEERTTYNKLIFDFLRKGLQHWTQPVALPSAGDGAAAGSFPDERKETQALFPLAITPEPPGVPLEFSVGRLVMGAGAGTYYTLFPLLRDGSITTQALHAHNDYLEFLLEFGIGGSFLLLLLVGSMTLTAVQAQVRHPSRLVQSMGFGAMMCLLCIGIHSTADFNLQIYANALTFIAIQCLPYAALAVPEHRLSNPDGRNRRS